MLPHWPSVSVLSRTRLGHDQERALPAGAAEASGGETGRYAGWSSRPPGIKRHLWASGIGYYNDEEEPRGTLDAVQRATRCSGEHVKDIVVQPSM